MPHRYRRLRNTSAIRNYVRETNLTSFDLLQPFFVIEGKNKKEAISSMPGIYRYSVDLLVKNIGAYARSGGRGGVFFGVSQLKDTIGKHAFSSSSPVIAAIKAVKKNFPDFLIITDVCLCAYMSHGHCGIVEGGKINNDKTLPVLSRMALAHAQAGADMVAPSDMMDGRVGAIREALDDEGYGDTPIMAYAAKYASSFYGPFREAAESTPTFGDRRSYQMDAPNSREALKEVALDIDEGADIVMVKPALAYLDIIYQVKQNFNLPVAAYNVSGEFSMVKAAAKLGWIDGEKVMMESLIAMKRAGADIILTYFAKEAAALLQ
jgi:porphobilinogen synthase